MPVLFNTIRAAVYATVLVFTVICLGMAGHFNSVLARSDLTQFVPFAIFVCTASLFIFMVLILFSLFLRERNPISTRIELAMLGLAGLFWLILGVYLTTSESQDADVECFTPDNQFVLDPESASFQTDQFQAMYRVLMSFALMNAALIIASALILLFLAYRKHRNGDKHVWHVPVTSNAWFSNYNNKGETTYTEKPQRRRTGDTMRSLLPTHTPSPSRDAAPAAAGAGAGAAALAAAVMPSRNKSSGRRTEKAEPAPPPTAYTQKPERKGSRGSGRGGDRSDPRRQDSTGSARRDAAYTAAGGASDPRRQNSGRSGNDNPRRQNSGTRREYRDLQQNNPYMAAYYNAPAPRRYAPSSPSAGSTQDFVDGGMVNPARQGRR